MGCFERFRALTIPEMENPFSPKEKEDDQWAADETLPAFGGVDVYNNSFSELLSFDYAGAGWPAATVDHGFYSPMDFVEQSAGLFSAPAETETETFIAEELVARDGALDEKMLRALSLVKESSSGGILAQVWVPMKCGDQLVLSTSEQPYLLDQILAGYREVSRGYTFSAEGRGGSVLGLPGRVFASRAPEWTSDVGYYHKHEYVRVEHAFSHHVRGSIALPVFQPHLQPSCCAVLELVTTREKPNFDEEIDIVCNALQAVNLATTPPPKFVTQYLSDNHKNAVTEIVDVLRVVCHAHRLPLALTWVPSYAGGDARLRCKTNPKERCVLCIEQMACYVNDRLMQGFAHACMEHHLQEGKGLAGKALQSNIPFFFPDVKTYDITEYPLVHHARKFGLSAAVAIRLRSTYTGDNDYVLEFFLPLNVKGAEEQQLLLNNLSVTMQRICKTLRTVSDLELAGGVASSDDVSKQPVENLGSAPGETSQMEFSNGDLNVSNGKTGEVKAADRVREKASGGSRRQNEKKRSIAEKNVSLSVLQQYFSGSLKDAAKSIGVCPTTLKRICRQHGISRWPSRKINKVNRSLRKIKTVLDSVQGVEAGLKFDPSTGGLVATGSVPQETDPNKKSLFHNSDPISTIKFEEDVYCTTGSLVVNSSSYDVKDSNIINMTDIGSRFSLDEQRPPPDHSKSQSSGSQEDLVQQNQPSCSSMTDSSNGGGSTLHVSSSSSQSFEEHESPDKTKTGDSKLVVKATYKEDTVRFKLDMSQPSCLQLYEQVGKRFKLQTGTFQLKYLDDEEEWVMLVSDMDLQECLEVLDDVGKTTVKFQVRDMPCNIGSSGSSNCYLPTG